MWSLDYFQLYGNYHLNLCQKLNQYNISASVDGGPCFLVCTLDPPLSPPSKAEIFQRMCLEGVVKNFEKFSDQFSCHSRQF
jgi:hypothetical protein